MIFVDGIVAVFGTLAAATYLIVAADCAVKIVPGSPRWPRTELVLLRDEELIESVCVLAPCQRNTEQIAQVLLL